MIGDKERFHNEIAEIAAEVDRDEDGDWPWYEEELNEGELRNTENFYEQN